MGKADPFQDPSQQSLAGDARLQPAAPGNSLATDTLSVGRRASLTLTEDSLIVLDEGLQDDDQGTCCGLIPSNTLSIPFYNVLWAELSEFDITVHYAHPISSNAVHPASVNYSVDKNHREGAGAWIEKLLERAYEASQRQKRIKVLVNPFGGKGNAQKWFTREIEPIFAAARCAVDVEITTHNGHAVEIAKDLDVHQWDVVASCSGDGLPHEVFNGLGKKHNATEALQQIAVVQLPCGSGNAMSWNLNGTDSPSMAALAVVKGLRTPLDLISVTQGDRRTLSFLSQSVGIVAECDLGTENIRWMGAARFTYGFLVRLLGKTVYPCDLAVGVEIDDKTAIKEAYDQEASKPPNDFTERRPPINSDDNGLPALRFGTVNDALPPGWTTAPYDNMGNFYAGNMAYMSADANFFQASLPSDGCLDMICIDGDIPRMTSIQSLLAVEKGTFFDLPHVQYRKVVGYRITPRNQKDGYISIDGESIPFEPFQCEVHKGLGTVLSKTGHLYEAYGPSGTG
ncbi:uncharacterized protein K452DRAFT_220407 [Aplosporella prunicola CBS 121167]|uniref:DAGKc domain-containing protein n=1 Tax=Aplosporella prunicola CBS 121167 TaxID=1176127 RepID=A0A6A6BPR4_9PEZI|nr:uncharacterized protein K452DRAFT_220407 [Aplosporella prunicola CBS 121167]KAF2145718.1 hypothetical protein K452DRAFT_220407 [Aplosporella prunicola CBS 121167]